MFEDNPPQPAGKGERLPKVAEVAIGVEKRLLRRVLGKMEVSEDRVRIAHGHVLEASDEL
jgi:hypothetical protein